MPLDASRAGAAIAATIKSFRPDPDEKITDAVLEQMWTAVCQDIFDEISDNADITFSNGDILIDSQGLISPTGPVTGSTVNQTSPPITGAIS